MQALRILSLLEDHHRKLAGLIKEAPRKTDKKASSPPASAPRTHRRLPQPAIASNLAEKRGIPSARRTTSGNVITVAGANANAHANAARDGQPTPVRDLLERQARKADQSRSRELAKPKEPEPPRPSSPSSS